MNDIPDEILNIIFSKIDYINEVNNISRTCKKFNKVVTNYNLHHELIKRRYSLTSRRWKKLKKDAQTNIIYQRIYNIVFASSFFAFIIIILPNYSMMIERFRILDYISQLRLNNAEIYSYEELCYKHNLNGYIYVIDLFINIFWTIIVLFVFGISVICFK